MVLVLGGAVSVFPLSYAVVFKVSTLIQINYLKMFYLIFHRKGIYKVYKRVTHYSRSHTWERCLRDDTDLCCTTHTYTHTHWTALEMRSIEKLSKERHNFFWCNASEKVVLKNIYTLISGSAQVFCTQSFWSVLQWIAANVNAIITFINFD